MTRETVLTRTLVELADTLVDEFDIVDFLHLLTDRAVELLGADAAGLILGDQRGELQVMASTSHEARLLELFQLQNAEGGPCLECCRTGSQLVNLDLAEAHDRWPRFHEATIEAGFRSAHAIPMRLRHEVVGALNLFCVDRLELTEADVSLAQAMADIATIGLLQERVIRQQELLSEQLQTALNSRVLIEQAKGVLAERASLGLQEAFDLIRSYGRGAQLPLTEVARGVVTNTISVEALRGLERPVE